MTINDIYFYSFFGIIILLVLNILPVYIGLAILWIISLIIAGISWLDKPNENNAIDGVSKTISIIGILYLIYIIVEMLLKS